MGVLSLILTFALSAQSADSFPPLGIVDFYGVRTVSETALPQSLPFHEGDAIDPDQFTAKKQDFEKRLSTVPGVKQAFLTLVCCTRLVPPPGRPKIEVPSRPLVELLNSCVWTDRNKSSAALAELTEARPPALLKQLQQDAQPSLIEMARWKNPGHAWSSLLIVGRIGGLTEEEIQRDVDHGNQESVIRAASATPPPMK